MLQLERWLIINCKDDVYVICNWMYFSRNDVIPMHDHPTMHGFIRVLRGSLRITSFSLLPTSTLDTPEVRFNGERDVSNKEREREREGGWKKKCYR